MENSNGVLLQWVAIDDRGKGHIFEFVEYMSLVGEQLNLTNVILASENASDILAVSCVRFSLRGSRPSPLFSKKCKGPLHCLGNNFLALGSLLKCMILQCVDWIRNKDILRIKSALYVWIDSPSPVEWLSMFCFVFIRRKESFWGVVLPHGDHKKMAWAFRCFLFVFERGLHQKVSVFSMNTSLVRDLKYLLKREVFELPLMIARCNVQREERRRGLPIVWWPGNPRPEKGWDVISRITKKEPTRLPWILHLSKNAELDLSLCKIDIELLKERLSNIEFITKMMEVDAVILPYSQVFYAKQYSLVFVHAVCAGTIPIVSDGTIMADELRHWGLDELILDWSFEQQCVDQIGSLLRSKELFVRMKPMQLAYRKENSMEKITSVVGRAFSIR